MSPSIEEILLNKRPIIDVRAPIEYSQGAIPNSVCLPLLDDQERALVGTTYKKKGQGEAIKLGEQLVSGDVKIQRIQQWVDFARKHPDAVITCFRGGLRSKTVQGWLKEVGTDLPRIEGGYKSVRNFFLDNIQKFCQQKKLIVISGATGSGKTLLLRKIEKAHPSLDLEKYANHRGSAFGGYATGQPAQVSFENTLSAEMFLLLNSNSSVLIEDESRMIGKNVQPESLFNLLRNSPVLLIEEDVMSRVENTYQDYILNSNLGAFDVEAGKEVFTQFKESLRRISKKLGGLRYQEILQDLQQSELKFLESRQLESNKVWIEKLLVYYYDPLYFDSLERRNPKLIFKGKRTECQQWILNLPR